MKILLFTLLLAMFSFGQSNDSYYILIPEKEIDKEWRVEGSQQLAKSELEIVVRFIMGIDKTYPVKEEGIHRAIAIKGNSFVKRLFNGYYICEVDKNLMTNYNSSIFELIALNPNFLFFSHNEILEYIKNNETEIL